jgi:hypothetical protein
MPKIVAVLVVALIIGCGARLAESEASHALATDTPSRSTGDPSPTPRLVDGAILWALDRGPELTPDQARLRVYLFGVGDLRGGVRLLGPDGTTLAEVGVMGSGVFSADSCVSRLSNKENGITAIGAVPWTDTAQTAFLANPTAYRADVDLGYIRPGAGHALARLEDSGCRPT